MKKIQFSVVLMLFLAAVSCKKTDNTATTGITTDEIAAISSHSLASSSDGMATHSNDITVNALSDNQACGSTVTDTITKSGGSNHVTFSYFLQDTRTLTCNTNNQHDNIVYDLAFHGHYESLDINSLDTGTSTFKIAGFTPGSSIFAVNGNYKRTGKFTSKIGDKVSGTSSVDIEVTNLTIDKATKTITGGSATITIWVTVPKGTFHFNGPLTFNGDGTASLTINGVTYTIDLLTGAVTKH
jgi:hypothetical protein